jgi:predicted O-linked N-acetylglucosamine transferase (SPINDLY family)
MTVHEAQLGAASARDVAGRAVARREIADALAGLRAAKPEDTLAACQALLAMDPQSAPAHFAVAATALLQGDLAMAASMLLPAAEADPREPLYAELLAVVYALAGQISEATYYAKLSTALGLDEAALALLPEACPRFAPAFAEMSARPLYQVARQLAARGEFELAADRLRQHLYFEPQDDEARRELVSVSMRRGTPWVAIAAAAPLDRPAGAAAADLGALARAHAAMGDDTLAADYHRRAMKAAPDDAALAAAYVADLTLFATTQEPELLAAAREWCVRFAARTEASSRPPRAEGNLRVGFLCTVLPSADDCEALATLRHLDRTQGIEVYGYGTGELADPANSLLRGLVHHWRNCTETDHLTLAYTVQSDGIDVLIDIGGFEAPVHLLAMAERPARRQVAWLGYPAARGLSMVDWVFGDAATDGGAGRPAGGLWPLPHGIRAFAADEAAIAAPPKGEILLGAEAGLAQLHPDLCAAWARILKETPTATLLLRRSGPLAEAVVRQLSRRFGDHGVADRIDVVDLPRDRFLAAIHLLLAPLAARSAATEAAALAAGVPVVTLAGSGRPRRQASGLLVNAGLADFVASDSASYVRLVRDLAGSPAALARARDTVLAARQSPVFAPEGFSRLFSDAIRAIAGQTP